MNDSEHTCISGAPLFTGGDYKNFYCRYNEPSYIKYLKLQLLTLLACQAAKTDSTCVNDILGEVISSAVAIEATHSPAPLC